MTKETSTWKLIDRGDVVPGGGELALYGRGDNFMVRIDGLELMNGETAWSEEAFVTAARQPLTRAPGKVLVGGLGLGYTLAEVCRHFPDARVDVVEISAAIIGWNLGPARGCNGQWLDTGHVCVTHQDLTDFLKQTDTRFDLILLDVDNGPEALVHPGNDQIYSLEGVRQAARCLAPGGHLVFWSAVEAPEFAQRLGKVFESVCVESYSIPTHPHIEHHYFIASHPRKAR